jgi:hypothetical protein
MIMEPYSIKSICTRVTNMLVTYPANTWPKGGLPLHNTNYVPQNIPNKVPYFQNDTWQAMASLSGGDI